MKRLFYLFTALAVSLSTMVACSENDVEEAPVTPPDPKPGEFANFDLAVTKVTKSSVDFKVVPHDKAMTYVVMISEKSYFEEFASDEEVMDDDLDWFQRQADQRAMNLDAFLRTILKQGTLEASEVGLQPGMEYYLYAYGMNEQGEVLTKMDKLSFTAEALDQTETSFRIELNDISFDKVSVKITPSDEKALYFVNVFSEDRYQEFGGNEEAFLAQLAYVRDYYLDKGATVEQIVANLALAGERELLFEDLLPDTKHYAYVIGVDREFFANTKATVEEFSTLSAEKVDMDFDIQVAEITYEGITGTITPTNDTNGYICSVQLAESLKWYDSEEEFINSIVLDLDLWYGGVEASLRYGTSELKYTGLFPETEYIVVCFGWNQAPTTSLTTYPFTTEAAGGNPEEFTLEFVTNELTHNSASVTMMPSNGCHYFFDWCEVGLFDEMVAELGSRDAAAAYFIEEEIELGTEWFGDRIEYLAEMGAMLGTCVYPIYDLTPDTEYLLFALPLDMTTGEIATEKASFGEKFRTLEKVMSDALVTFEFDNIYDGSELAVLDPENFLQCTGYAVMPYKVEANETAANWYTGFYNYDMSEWIDPNDPDDDIYTELITWGWDVESDLVSLNRTEGVAVMAWDMTFTFLGIAEDENGNFGHGTIETIIPTKDQVAPAEELLEKMESAPAALHRGAKRPMARRDRAPHGLKQARR